MPALANILNTDLSKGFTVPQVAEKHGWTGAILSCWERKLSSQIRDIKSQKPEPEAIPCSFHVELGP